MGREGWKQQSSWIRSHAVDAVISIAMLEGLGVGSSTAYRRCQSGGPWQWMLPGVVLLHSGTASAAQREHAALLYAGPVAQLTGAAAASRHGLQRVVPDGRVHVLVPGARRRCSAGFALVERTERLPEPVTVRGLACAPVERAVLDHARRLRNPEAVQALIAEAVQRRYCTPDSLVAELEAGSARGTALVRRELREIVGGARSVAEVRAKRLVRGSGLPPPLWNVRLVDRDDRYIGTPDAWWPEVGLAWEIDSVNYHLSPADHARTFRRDGRYAAHGVAVLPTLPSRLTGDPDAVIAELRDAYAAALRRLPPDGITVARPMPAA